MNGRPIGEDDLQAFVDGRLDAERQVEVAAYLERHADVARRVDGYRRQRDALRAALAPVAEEPVPPELNLARMIERSEEHTSELQSLMRISYAVFCLKKKKQLHILSTIIRC